MIMTGMLALCLFIGMNQNVIAREKSVDYKQLVKDAFHTQVTLSEKERSLKEIKEMLNIHFTKDFIALFLKENLVKTEQGYQTFGSDFPLYYIPFFSYNIKTVIKKVGKKIYVYENMADKNDGPVVYKNDYQGVRLTSVHGSWKIDEILYDVPQNIIHQSALVKISKTKEIQKTNLLGNIELQSTHLLLNPFTAFIMPTNMKPFWLLISKFM